MIRHRRVFYLNSANRLGGTDASECTLQINIPSHEAFTHVLVVEANIPKSYYLVQAGYNTFTIVENTVPRTITLTPANYGATCFATCLTAALNAGAPAGWAYAVSLPSTMQPQTGKWTFTVAGNNSQPSIVTTTNLYEQLGLDANSTNSFVANTLVSTNVIKLQSEDALYLHSDIVTEVGDDTLQEIYTVGIPDFGIINYKCTEWAVMAKPIKSMKGNTYRFALTDENGRVMNLNGLNWVMTLMVFSVDLPLTLKV